MQSGSELPMTECRVFLSYSKMLSILYNFIDIFCAFADESKVILMLFLKRISSIIHKIILFVGEQIFYVCDGETLPPTFFWCIEGDGACRRRR